MSKLRLHVAEHAPLLCMDKIVQVDNKRVTTQAVFDSISTTSRATDATFILDIYNN